MRRAILLLIIFALYAGHGYSQSVPGTVSASSNPGDYTVSEVKVHQKHHCGATRVGEAMIIAGGAFVATGGLFALENVTSGPQRSSQTDVAGGIVAGVGLGIAFYGGIVFVCGKLYEHKHRDRFSIVGSRNLLGIAYRF